MKKFDNPKLIPAEFIDLVKPVAHSHRVMVFSDLRMTENVVDYANEQGIQPIRYLHSDIDPQIQLAIIRGFRCGFIQFMATVPDFAERYNLFDNEHSAEGKTKS